MAKATKAAAPLKSAAAPVKKAAKPAAAGNSDANGLKDLLLDELKDIYWAEKHITKALPKMKKAATSSGLANAFDQHLAVTQNQIARLEQVFEILGEKARAKKCDAMEGIVQEGQGLMGELPKGTAVMDAGLIAAGQKVEHYEIATYGTLVQWAKTLGLNDVADLLAQTLAEEKEADVLLTELAESAINLDAEAEPSEEE
jgi:ferritin-like metal-binding protein YciE